MEQRKKKAAATFYLTAFFSRNNFLIHSLIHKTEILKTIKYIYIYIYISLIIEYFSKILTALKLRLTFYN